MLSIGRALIVLDDAAEGLAPLIVADIWRGIARSSSHEAPTSTCVQTTLVRRYGSAVVFVASCESPRQCIAAGVARVFQRYQSGSEMR